MVQVIGGLGKYPARALAAWYLGLISTGTLLLALPLSRAPDRPPITLLDALFTATSASCVTGLTVRSTPHDFSFAGQLVILALMQLGGLGIMTVTTWITLTVGRATLRHRAVLHDTLGLEKELDLRRVLRSIVILVVSVEAVGFLLLAARHLLDQPVAPALWHALFHAVSAFCNAGFALHDDSLEQSRGDLLVNGVVASLIIIGGIGFPVLRDLGTRRQGTLGERWRVLHLHTKTMLIGTAFLLLAGMLILLALEWNGALADLPLHEKLQAAAFQSATARTAGFNTIPIGLLTPAALFLLILLMMIGGGPCSAAGGIKVSTFMLLAYRAGFALAGRARVNVFRRTIPDLLFHRAMTTAFLFSTVAVLSVVVVLSVEQSNPAHADPARLFVNVMFEVFSALGTVGLSTGVTADLSATSRTLIIVLMFVGRVGPISVLMALSRGERAERLEYPQEGPLTG